VLLDLACSEHNEDSSYHDAAWRKEAIEINKSHRALKECVRAIESEDSAGFVPYRECDHAHLEELPLEREFPGQCDRHGLTAVH
jgi:hypothetical protein